MIQKLQGALYIFINIFIICIIIIIIIIIIVIIIIINSVTILPSQMKWLTFLLGSQFDSDSPAFLDLFLSSGARICSIMAFPSLANSDHVLSQFPLTFHQIHNRCPISSHSL